MTQQDDESPYYNASASTVEARGTASQSLTRASPPPPAARRGQQEGTNTECAGEIYTQGTR